MHIYPNVRYFLESETSTDIRIQKVWWSVSPKRLSGHLPLHSKQEGGLGPFQPEPLPRMPVSAEGLPVEVLLWEHVCGLSGSTCCPVVWASGDVMLPASHTCPIE